ncbi:NAD(P)-binding Rossmann-like domain-containing protein [Actinokineospora iranica]|uniref:NAD(P)-binding Rossmann-like domain-containing protein n=1 Tax=Actinokineospora iranica TaxID=1271860 RepID=A0A1G6JQ45_9PSEU|nr:NAD(P)-binding Rossmann-like domain-containing protein [Actinokineospora iranica]
MTTTEHVDVLIVGAGLSGIGAARHIQEAFPRRSYTILEARAAIGGTWDLFRYPGIRSDSDMNTLGYRFRPWTNPKSIADGPSILRYVRDTAAEEGIDRHIRCGHRVIRAEWSTQDARWTVDAVHDGVPVTFTCHFKQTKTPTKDGKPAPAYLNQEPFTTIVAINKTGNQADDWVQRAVNDIRRGPWSLVVLHDLPTGAMRHLPEQWADRGQPLLGATRVVSRRGSTCVR